jgi:hypothetical protein
MGETAAMSETTRDEFERCSGMSAALREMRETLASTGALPLAVCVALCQGPEESLARINSRLANFALVAALFIVGALEAILNPPDALRDLEAESWQYVAFSTLLAVSIACFVLTISFFVHMANYLPRTLLRDADVFLFLLRSNFDSGAYNYCILPIEIGVTGVVFGFACAICAVYPPFVVLPVAFALFLPVVRLIGIDRRYGAITARGGVYQLYRHAQLQQDTILYLLDHVYAARAAHDENVLMAGSASRRSNANLSM